MTRPRARSQGNSGRASFVGKPSLSAASSPINSRDTRYTYFARSARLSKPLMPITAGTLFAT